MARRRRRKRIKRSVSLSFTSTGLGKKKDRVKHRRNKSQTGFETTNESPFDSEEVSTSKVVENMQIRYNLTSDEKRFRTMSERGFINSQEEYDKLIAIYQSDVYHMLQEQGYSDSHQIRDLIQSYDSLITARDIENALLGLIDELKLEQTYNTKVIRDAMDLGFTFDEAVYLTEQDRTIETKQDESLLAIRDRLDALLETKEIRYQLMQELEEEEWD